MLSAFVQGLVLAFGLILPLGIQNVFIFNQGVTQPRFSKVLPVLFTASICDSLLIGSAIGGVSLLVFSLPLIETSIMVIGILFLLYMGVVMWRSKPPGESSSGTALSPRKQILFAASVSLLNPHAIIDSIGVIGTSSIGYEGAEKVVFAVTCICVSWVWFFSLGFAGSRVKQFTDSTKFIRIFNKVSSLIMWGTALYLAYRLSSG